MSVSNAPLNNRVVSILQEPRPMSEAIQVPRPSVADSPEAFLRLVGSVE